MTPTQAAAVCAEARTWVHTPYHHRARVKGHGVDCAHLLIAVYAAVGLIQDFDPGFYTSDWFLHRSEEQYMGWLMKFADRIDRGEPGDVALYRMGRTASHGAIIIEGDILIHAYRPALKVEMLEMRALASSFDSFWRVRG